ncbi:MAG TPA: IS1595 family transposase [Candidatus Marinimicrobia bacterium]|nr:IS1595 family transposase [Candidatus Neomarinimicrobiota bacterium]
MNKFQAFTEYFLSCNEQEREQIISRLMDLLDQSTGQDYSDIHYEEVHKHGIHCPHCSSSSIRANGKHKGLRTYYCKECTKYFSETTGTPIAWLKKKDKWRTYLRCMLSGYSLRRCAQETDICLQTSFDWRHKILSGFKSLSPEKFEGISESDDIFFLHSEKGNKHLQRKAHKRGSKAKKAGINDEHVAVIVTSDRAQHKDMQIAGTGRISKKDLDRVVGSKVDQKTVLCTDSHRSYSAFAKSKKIEHHKINVSKGQYVKNKVYHVQHVNNDVKRLRQWMDHFNGVSTKYLQNYRTGF